MGGGAMPEQGGSGKRKKKALDATINVVPAIDLLSCCITFLLYTAVWTQISRLQVQQLGTGAPEPTADRAQKHAHRDARDGRARLQPRPPRPASSIDIPTLGRGGGGQVRFDLKALGERLKTLKGQHPDAAAVTVPAEDTVPYGDLVQVIDTCVGAGLVSVSVTGV